MRFKKLWEENISPRHEDSALHYMLCESLPKKVLDNISTLSNSAEDIWAYLDEKYGKPEIVAREVMAELMGLDSRKLGQQFMGKFCTMLLDTHSLLVTLNEVDWLVTNKTVAEMEDKLPREERLELAKQMSTIGGESRFEKFRNFLQTRKIVLENVELMGCKSVGDGGGTRCGYCNKPGHAEDRCFTKQRDQVGQVQGGPAGHAGGRGFPNSRGGCAICQSEDHWKNECPDRGTDRDKRAGKKGGSYSTRVRQGARGGQGGGNSGGGGSVTAEVGSNTLRAHECPRCKASSKLTYCAGCKKTANITHCLLHCESFMVLSVKDRAEVVKTSKSCPICLHSSHTADRCYNKDKDNYICGVNGCHSHHHPCLHGSKDIYVTGVNVLLRQQTKAVTTACHDAFLPVGNWLEREQYVYDSYAEDMETGQVKSRIFCQTNPVLNDKRVKELEEVKAELAKPLLNGDKVLMTVMKIEVIYGIKGEITQVVGFFDDGSNCSVIKNSLAVKLGLLGDPVTLELGTVNATTTLETKLYCLELLDEKGGRHLVKAFGLESISGELPSIMLDGIKHEFSKEVQRNWSKFARPVGEIEVLIGSEVAQLHPVHHETVGKMLVKKSNFGTGWVLNGGHERIMCGKVEFDGNVQVIRSGFFRSNKITITYTQDVNINTVEEYKFGMTEKEFMWAESLGCEAPRRCQDCRGCKECGFRGAHMSQQEAVELRMMEDGVSFDESIGKWRVKYPFIQDPRVLSNNYKRVLRMMESTERKLAKLGETEAANEVFQKMVAIGALKEVDAAELRMWSGPVHYLPIQAVIKPASVTTRVRLVTNSSLVDPATGLSLNSIMAKGPKYLNDMWEILVRFRHHEAGLISDITKAYYQMRTGLVERHVRRVLWRNGEVGTPWKIYAFEVVSMGDTPAANFMEITKRKTADRGAHIDEAAAKKLKEDSFVDDISTGGKKLECLRFKGNEDPKSLSCDGTMQEILNCGGYTLKAMGMSGEPDGEALEKLGGTVLGLRWSSAEDMLEEKFRVNVSEYRRGEPTAPDLTPDTLDQLTTACISKRVCLRTVNSQYIPLGISTPLLVIMKVQMKELYKLEVEWDKPLDGGLRESWVRLFDMLVRAGGVKFKRATRPENAVGKCILVCFFDGADAAFGIAIYVRWELEDGTVWVYLLAAKCKIAPMFATSTPRM